MTDPLRLAHIRTTSQIFRRATFHFSANPLTFLLLALLLFSFRSLVESGSLFLTTFIDRDPSLRSLLSRIDLSQPHAPRLTRTRRRPFLHLTRVGTLDDDFFSSDDDHRDRSLFGSHPIPPLNATPLLFSNFDPKLGFSASIVDNGILLPQVIRPGVRFKFASVEQQQEEEEQEPSVDAQEMDRVVDFQFFIKGLELGRRDTAALFFLVSLLSAAYGWVILGFTAIYSCVSGVVFVTVANDLIGRLISVPRAVWNGSKLGFKRLTGFILMRWAVRDAMTQLLGLWYFGEIEDQYSVFKLFVRLKLLPFSVMAPWIRGFQREISSFLFAWFLLDTFVAFIFSVDAWIAVVDTRRNGRDVVKEGCYLMSTMLNQAIQIKCYEAILGGSFARWVLAAIGGESFASFIQSALEVYFMVAWLIFYFVARSRGANGEGRHFGRRELEGLVDGLR